MIVYNIVSVDLDDWCDIKLTLRNKFGKELVVDVNESNINEEIWQLTDPTEDMDDMEAEYYLYHTGEDGVYLDHMRELADYLSAHRKVEVNNTAPYPFIVDVLD